jgi:hypothetical protein
VLFINSSACWIAHSLITDNHLANVSARNGTTCHLYHCVITRSGRSGIFARDRHTVIRVTGGEARGNANNQDVETELEAEVTFSVV